MKERILNALLLAGISVGISLAAYFSWFFVYLKLPLSTSPEVWGQFGSYMAGTAGVSFALATVWMLADTLRLQRSELQLSRVEMKKSSEALAKQVELAKKSDSKENFFYILQTVDTNIESISNQTIGNAPEAPIVKMLFNNRTLPKGKAQILAIATQYMNLVNYIINLPKGEKEDAILISQPIVLKNFSMLAKISKHGYFDNFKPHLKEQAINILRHSRDVIYTKPLANKSNDKPSQDNDE
jgi:hypothetical protein